MSEPSTSEARPINGCLLAFDLGATSGRVILGEWHNDRLALTEVHRFPNAFRSLAGHDYWEIGALWHEAQIGLRQAAAALQRSIDTLRHEAEPPALRR